jgi:hypothetical protein
MSKQDRQGVRRVQDIEQKYNLALLGDLEGKTANQDEKLSQFQQQFTQFMVSMNGKIADLENKLYPIGSFYVSVNSTDPTELFGGTWEFYTEGHLLIGLEPEENALPKMLQISDKCYVWKRLA